MEIFLILLIVLAIVLLLAGALLIVAWRGNRSRSEATIASKLDVFTGRFDALGARIDTLDKRLDEGLKDTATRTAESLGSIQTRLSVIDEAQKNITELSGQVVSLQEIFTNKQSRGLFGQAQMEAIIADALPPGVYEFQATLSNGNRPDCVIRLPGTGAAIVIDSKFPLEAFTAIKDGGDGERKVAAAAVRTSVLKHVKDIADKYIIPGETQTPAIMFVPSESIYAELHENFGDVLQKARTQQVTIVSPNVLMLAVTTVQTVMKDARMREQANLIQKEVGLLLVDVKRLGERVVKLQSHFNQAEGDIKDVATSTEKIISRAGKIEAVELSPATAKISTDK